MQRKYQRNCGRWRKFGLTEIIVYLFTGKRGNMRAASTSSCTEKISTQRFNLILERLKANQNRKSTQKNYHTIWRQFGKFLIKLDEIPLSWEQRLCLYGTYLVERGAQSSTLRSYMSALKHILKTDGFKIQEDKIMLGMLVRACKLENDRIYIRFPIKNWTARIITFRSKQTIWD